MTSTLFQKRKRKYRAQQEVSEKESSSSSEEPEENDEKRLRSTLEDIKDLQKMRVKSKGLSAEELALGKEAPKKAITSTVDPLKLKTGGMIDLRRIKQSDLKEADIEDDIRQNFSKESRLRDEDEEMRKYVEEELSRRKGKAGTSADEEKKTEPEDVFELPDRLKKYQSKKNEEMLSNQMLCGIPEVNLGVETKIKNIEETESAKLRLLREAAEKRKNLAEATSFNQNLVKDLSKDYVQHSIYSISETTDLGMEGRVKPDRPPTEAVPVVGEETPLWMLDGKRISNDKVEAARKASNKSTDKHVYQKFKQKMSEKK